jgi:hypothetical protein
LTSEALFTNWVAHRGWFLNPMTGDKRRLTVLSLAPLGISLCVDFDPHL